MWGRGRGRGRVGADVGEVDLRRREVGRLRRRVLLVGADDVEGARRAARLVARVRVGPRGEEEVAARAAGERWRRHLDDGRWACREDDFWAQPSPMWEMPGYLRSDMVDRCDLAFVKGDANYRRLLGDRQWDYSAPFRDVVGCYFPCPVCALRTLKAEVGCGMAREQVERAMALDDGWMVNGRFGVVQFSKDQLS